MRLARYAALAALMLTADSAARGQNLVTNAGFEAGTYTDPADGVRVPIGYTFTTRYPGQGSGVYVEFPHTGAYAFGFSSPADEVLAQSIASTPGTVYQFSFFAAATGGVRTGLQVAFGSQTLNYIGGSALDTTYRQFSARVVATAPTSKLSFTGFNSYGTLYLDDVSVTALPGAVVPEPGTWALVGVGLLGVGLVASASRRARA